MSKSTFSLIVALALSVTAYPQYWQQQVNYIIDVSLNDKEHTLEGFEKIVYKNNSPDTINFIWFHLWPNAYKNDRTAFSEQLLNNNRTDFYFSNKEQRGYINRLDFKVNGVTAQTTDHPQYIDIIKLLLPTPLPPGEQALINTPFHVQLPENFSRGGHTGQTYQVTQWFPKPAVYDHKGWHPIPYLDQGEFYSEFGNFDVRITVPENYVVAATGELQNEEEKEWMKQRASFNWQPVTSKIIVKKGSYKHVKKTVQRYPASLTKIKTIQFIQNNVHDFAWFADKRFVVQQDTIQLASGRTVTAYSYYLPGKETPWKNSVSFIKRAIHFRSLVMGEYPYNTVSAVEAKMGFNGGMEYPTITSISPAGTDAELEYTIEHEVGHNWLQGILATNERQYPWMDEGMNTYYDNRYTPVIKEIKAAKKNKFIQQRSPQDMEGLFLQSLIAVKKDQPINTPAENFTELNNDLSAYYKTGKWMKILENYIGQPVFDSCMKEYYTRWQFKHPYPEDFKAVITQVSGKNTDDIFQLIDKKGELPPLVKRQIKPVAFFNFNNTNKYSYVNILPAAGYNQYDKFMVGLLVHNYSLPAEKFQFLAAPMYATGSKKFNYLARASYTWYPENIFYKTEIGISAAAFSMDDYEPSPEEKITLGFRKIAPFIRFTLKETGPHSKRRRYIQFTPFFIQENALNFKTVINGPDTTDVVEKTSGNRYINQLKFVIENNRILYPYRAQLLVEQADGFVRAAFTGNYYFNYSNNKSGLSVRLFAGKFFYTGAKTITKQFETDRYQLNMTGANGYEDYTYSNYFLGRNEFEGTANRQIMIRDGGFKVRTDLLSSKIGKTDNWLGAINFVSDIADKKFPLKIFADIGTYAGAWQNDAQTSRFLFDAGLQLSILHETVNIYLPLLSSKEFRDYFRSTLGTNYLLKTISFSIDIQDFRLKKMNKNLDF
ncbi:MAG: M1 family metallopeptidase [Chitinophagaceae bacterium]